MALIVEAKVDAFEICIAIEDGDFSKKEIIEIKSACNAALGQEDIDNIISAPGLWSQQWLELANKLAKKCPNPLEFEQKISEIINLD